MVNNYRGYATVKAFCDVGISLKIRYYLVCSPLSY